MVTCTWGSRNIATNFVHACNFDLNCILELVNQIMLYEVVWIASVRVNILSKCAHAFFLWLLFCMALEAGNSSFWLTKMCHSHVKKSKVMTSFTQPTLQHIQNYLWICTSVNFPIACDRRNCDATVVQIAYAQEDVTKRRLKQRHPCRNLQDVRGALADVCWQQLYTQHPMWNKGHRRSFSHRAAPCQQLITVNAVRLQLLVVRTFSKVMLLHGSNNFVCE